MSDRKSSGNLLVYQSPGLISSLQSAFVHVPREHETLLLSYPLNHRFDPFPVFFVTQAMSPPSIHAIPNVPRVQLGFPQIIALTLLIENVKQKSDIQMLEAQFG